MKTQRPKNCLRCRFCDTLPETDFKAVIEEGATTRIFCNKVGHKHDAVLDWCKITSDRRPTKGVFEHKAPSRYAISCDISAARTQAETLFIKQLWNTSISNERLRELTGRSQRHIREIAVSFGYPFRKPDKNLTSTRHRATKQRTGTALNQVQIDKITELYNSPIWPRRGGNNKDPETLAKRHENQRLITEQISALGRSINWRGCVSYIHHQSPAYQARKRKK